MFKLKNIFLTLLLLTLGFSSCSKDNSTSETVNISIVGKWQYTKIGTVTNNQEVLTNYQHTSGCTKDYIEIITGGIVKSYQFNNPNCQETIDTGTWNKNNNFVVLSYPNQPIINGEILELTNTTLKVKFINSGITDLEVLTRIP